jgi:hypothetical protein
MRLASDRELLEDNRRRHRMELKRSMLTILVIVIASLGSVGVILPVSERTSLSTDVMGLITVLVSAALLVPPLWLLHRGSAANPSPEQPFSEIDPVQWEALLDEPVPLQPDTDAPPRPRRDPERERS